MRGIAAFLRTTLLRGLLVTLPILLLWGVFREAFAVAKKIATPIVRLLPKATFPDSATNKEAAAFLVLLGGSFIIGLLLRAPPIRRSIRWVESRTLDHLPGYSVLRGVVSETAHIQTDSATRFRPAMLSLGDGARRPAYVTEDHGDGNLTVFLPGAPAAFSGAIHIVPRDRVVFLDATLGELAMSNAQYGEGCAALMKRKPMNVEETPPSG